MDLSSKQLRFKIEVNAKENHMSGITVIVPGLFSVVVVEGGVKTLRRYEKLMLKRIQWNAPFHNNDDGDNDEQDDNGDETGRKKNSCHLVWSGMVKSPSFRGRFRTEEVMTEISGRRIFEERGVGHYWDIASSFTVDE
jgi:U4/U6 small nuclear ribonucleoprotein PRP3